MHLPVQSRMLIDQLEKEREELDTILVKMSTSQNKAKDEQNTRKLKELSGIEKEHQQQIKEERDNIARLDTEVN